MGASAVVVRGSFRMTAFSLASATTGTWLSPFIHGTYFDGYLQETSPGGSFFTASLILSLLVIPVIARATEEGCRSLPLDLREGSLALGASEETTLWRVVLPWSLPNIVTAVLLGSAEAAGSVAVLMFIAPSVSNLPRNSRPGAISIWSRMIPTDCGTRGG